MAAHLVVWVLHNIQDVSIAVDVGVEVARGPLSASRRRGNARESVFARLCKVVVPDHGIVVLAVLICTKNDPFFQKRAL